MSELLALTGEEEFKVIADFLPTLCWLANEKGEVVYRNRRWFDYCGMPFNTDFNTHWYDAYHPGVLDRLLESWKHCIETGEDFKETFLLKGADGAFRPFLTHAVPITVNGVRKRWLGISVDVSERAHVEQELRKSEERLTVLNQTLEARVEERAQALAATEEQLRQSQKMEAVGQLTGGLAHDFNNILTGIMGNLELMERRIKKKQYDGLDRYLSNARQASVRAGALTQRLLAFSRRQTLDPKPVILSNLVLGLRDLIERTIGPHINLSLEILDSTAVAYIDALQLENALLNLCINSRDALPYGGYIVMRVSSKTVLPENAKSYDILPGDYVCLEVVDNGCGMDKATASKAFDPFFTTKPIGQGTGLGLSMIYGFSRQSKGHVKINSLVDHGTTVSILLPRHDNVSTTDLPQTESKDSVPSNGTILVVDDEENIRYLLNETLTDAGYKVLTAGDGIEALKILESKQYLDALVTDVGLPNGMNGKQVADAARNLRPDLKILFITGYAEQSVMGDAVFGNGIELLTKPFGMVDFVERVVKLLN